MSQNIVRKIYFETFNFYFNNETKIDIDLILMLVIIKRVF